jgi:hypothetical protein
VPSRQGTVPTFADSPDAVALGADQTDIALENVVMAMLLSLRIVHFCDDFHRLSSDGLTTDHLVRLRRSRGSENET